MANVRLLRQQVTDYQRKYALDRRKYEKNYNKYAADSEAFNAEMTRMSAETAAQVGPEYQYSMPYYDSEKGYVVDAVTGAAVTGIGGQDVSAAIAATQPSDPTIHNQRAWAVGDKTYDSFMAARDAGGQSIFNPFSTAEPDQSKAITAVVWDAYGNAWRRYLSSPDVPTQHQTKAPNLTQKEVGILQGEVSPYSYAEMAKEDTSPTSAFADPEDPYNLKDAGVLTRAIAGKI